MRYADTFEIKQMEKNCMWDTIIDRNVSDYLRLDKKNRKKHLSSLYFCGLETIVVCHNNNTAHAVWFVI